MKTFEVFSRNGKFHVKRDACRRKIDAKIVAFLSSVVYYFGDLLKLANEVFYGTKRSLVYNLIVYYHHCLF